MHVIEIRDAELMETITRQVKALHITNGAIVSLIGAVDAFTISTMPADDATKDTLTDYDKPAEMSGTGEIVGGIVHIHAVMAIEGDHAVSGHLHRATIGTWFARAYVLPARHPDARPRVKRLEDFDYTANPDVPPTLIRTLTRCAWGHRPTAVRIGDSGTASAS